MQYYNYINFNAIQYQPKFTTVRTLCCWFFVSFFITVTGCTSTEKNNTESDLQEISKTMVDMVPEPEVPQPKNKLAKASTENNHALDQNAYLAQEVQRMSGVDIDTINTYEKAIAMMSKQQWQAAIALFDKVIEKQPTLSAAYVNKALILRHQKKQSDLIEPLIEKAIDVNELNPYAHYIHGQLLQDKHQFKQAEQAYRKALSIWPKYSDAQLSLAILLELYRGKLLEAEHYYDAYLQQNKNDKQVQRWQAALHIKMKRAGLSLPPKQE